MENFENDRIDELLAKYFADEATPPEQRAVEEWVGEDTANRHYFDHFKLIWEGGDEVVEVNTPDTHKAWQRFLRHAKKEDARKAGKWNWRNIAAAILLMTGVAAITYYIVNNEGPAANMLAFTTHDEVKADTLPDGSIATLNKHSQITYPSRFKSKERKVILKGEAFFAVTPGRENPFVIEINDVSIKVIGTSFNVRSDKGETEVIVETGIVQVTRHNSTVELKAGERVLLLPADSTVTEKKVVSGDKLYNYYISRTFICDNTPLWKLVEKLNEAYNVTITIDGKGTAALPLSVTFDEESLDVILKIISQTLGVRVAQDGDTIRIY